jgi:hypothetical protein
MATSMQILGCSKAQHNGFFSLYTHLQCCNSCIVRVLHLLKHARHGCLLLLVLLQLLLRLLPLLLGWA